VLNELGQCAVMVLMMILIEDSCFGFIAGDLPVGTSDIFMCGQVRAVSRLINNYCVAGSPQGKKGGGISEQVSLQIWKIVIDVVTMVDTA